MKKILSVFLIVLMFTMLFSTTAYANDKDNMFDWISKGTNNESIRSIEDGIEEAGGGIYSILIKGGLVVGLIMLVLIGFGYWTNNGSAQGKEKNKERAISFIKGVVVVFGATGIMFLLYQFAVGLF